MTVRTFFTILAVLSFLFGIGFVLASGQVLANYGIELSPALALVGRLFGGALLTLGVTGPKLCSPSKLCYPHCSPVDGRRARLGIEPSRTENEFCA
jgi:hypothetical protein